MSQGFLSRWARRKEAVRAAGQADRPADAPDPAAPEGLPDPTEAARSPEAPAPETSFEAATGAADAEDALAALPSLDALTAETDLSPFLRAGVPALLRNAALRRMWSLDPAIRDFVSEAREYAYDWNTPGGAPGFGALLPGDDVKAMLERLVGSAEKRADAPPQDESAPETGDAGARVVDTAEPDPVAAPVAVEALPPPDSQDVPAPVALAEPATEGVAEPPPVRPRLRRHGGAMPA